MDAVCLLVAGIVQAMLPTAEFSIAWNHSVEKTRWDESYRVADGRIELTGARLQGLGAGMEPPPGAVLEGGWWRWRAHEDALPELRLTYSTYTADYQLCWNHRCEALAAVLGRRPADGDVVSVRACAAP